MYVKENTLTKESVTLVLELEGNYTITYGEDYLLEKLNTDNNEYERVKSLPGKDCVVNDIGYVLTNDKPREIKQDWSQRIGICCIA